MGAVALIAGLLAGEAAVAQSALVADRRVLALLGSLKQTDSARKVEQRRLLAGRPKWQHDPLAVFLIDRRLARNYADLGVNDSAYLWLRHARREAGPLGRAAAADVSLVYQRLGDYYYKVKLDYDSAAVAYAEQARRLQLSGRSLTDTARAVLLEGKSDIWLGKALAQAYANTGVALRQKGDLGGTVRWYIAALKQFTAINDGPGMVWAHVLLGHAYKTQGNLTQATRVYENALRVARVPRDSAKRSEEYIQPVDVLQSYSSVLILQKRYAYLLELTHELSRKGEALLLKERHHDTSYREILTALGLVYWYETRTYLLVGQPAAAAAALARLDATLRRLYAASPSTQLRQDTEYYASQAQAWGLHSWLAWQQHDAAAQIRARQTAVRYLDSIGQPNRRILTGRQVAIDLTEARDYRTAVTLLEPAARLLHTQGATFPLRATYEVLSNAYAGAGQYDSAYQTQRRYQILNDTLRAAQQYATLTEAETRYQTAQKEVRITQLAANGQRQQRQKQLAWLGLGVLALLLGGVGWVLRNTRRLNHRLAEQRQQLEQQAEQLTELDRAKSAFFANVSHELRTPLTLIVGPVEQTLQQADATWDVPTLRERLNLTLRNGRRLQSLVNGLLDLSKIDAGRLEAHPTLVELAPFFQELLAAFVSLAQERRIQLTATVGLPAGRWVLVDTDKVEKVVTNLLANALKFTPAGGAVTVQVSAEADEPDRYRVGVADTGPGIAPTEQARVFERFYQSHSHGAQGGTGIGLALSRELAELLGGSLTLASRPGHGSTFTFAFRALAAVPTPATADAALLTAAADDSPVVRPDGRRPRVLVVEDNADLRVYLRQILGPHYEVLEAENGRQALELLEKEDVDLISSDAMMPELDGMALLEHVRTHPRWRPVPFLMLTARAATEHRLAALELGVDDYLPKPFLARELLARVRNLLVNYQERMRWQADALLTPDDAPAADAAVAPPAVASPATEPAPAEPDPVELHTDPALLAALRELVPTILADSEYSPAELAAYLRLSERSLYRKLKEQTGLTPAGWLREVRLDHARQLLEARTLPTVAEVAYAAGFQDANYFGQIYAKRFGKKPSEY